MKHNPKSLNELKSERIPIQNSSNLHKEKLGKLDRIALIITNKIGTLGFFIIIFTWTFIWISWNAFGPAQLRFDPFPAFALWLFISNMIQIFLMPLIMIGQNLESKHAEIRAEADFEINKKAEREIETILQHLENHEEILKEIREKIK